MGATYARRAIVLVATSLSPFSCAPPTKPPAAARPATPTTPVPRAQPPPQEAPKWPEGLVRALAGHGPPHAQPIALPRDGGGRERWLAFVGPSDVAWGAWRVTLASDGTAESVPVERWPTGVRVVGGFVEDRVAYVLLESAEVLDQPRGLRGAWIDSTGGASPFEASPMALGDVRDIDDLAARVKHRPRGGSSERNAVALLAALRAASASPATLARALSTDGVDIDVGWQSLFAQRVGHMDVESAPSSASADRVLAVMRSTILSHACGADACEAWTDRGHAVVRFAVESGRWAVRSVIEDASVMNAAATSSPREVASSTDVSATETLLRARAREVREVLGEAPLQAGGGTIGLGLTDLAPDVPVVAIRERDSARVFALDAGAVRSEANDARWDAAFADVDGDGRTDFVVRMSGRRGDGTPLSWTQTFLAPPPSVQASAVASDPASALAVMDAADAHAAAHLAASIPARGVSREDACRLLATASTPAGFRRVATPDARLLLFDEPGMPTWRAKVVPLAKLAADDVRGLDDHCAELVCEAARPYCGWSAGSDSEHAWFAWRYGRAEIVGAALYHGE